MSEPAADAGTTRRVWPWLALTGAMLWVALVRVPIVLNAESHLDSDLAVDGITLRQAVEGRWRWHYPGTPHMGILPVILSWPQAMIWGANPITLVSGGVVAYELVIVATFLMNRRAFGPNVAACGLVPLAFSSTGVVWLSGRITGGHLLTVAWAGAAFVLLPRAGWEARNPPPPGGRGPDNPSPLAGEGGRAAAERGGETGPTARTTASGIRRAGALGLWCGVGLYLDRMFLLALVAIAAAGALGWWWGGRSGRLSRAALAFILGLVVGYVPHLVGKAVDPHDAYGEQFVSIFRPFGEPAPEAGIPWDQAGKLAVEHGRILIYECIPRLIAGHTLPYMESEPRSLPSGISLRSWPRGPQLKPVELGATAYALTLLPLALLQLVIGIRPRREPIASAIRAGLLVLCGLVVAGFILNRNIFNSDNYRYLVLLLLPWSAGFGLLMGAIFRRGRIGRAAAVAIALLFAVQLTADTWKWYRDFGWVEGLQPVRRVVRDPVHEWLESQPDVETVLGSYWRVYRLTFLSSRPLRAVPFPGYPLRFPEWSMETTGGPSRVLIDAPQMEPYPWGASAIARGARERFRSRSVTIYEWP
jgi:hypothetical protein